MITFAVASRLKERALSAYYRAGKWVAGQPIQPSPPEICEVDGRFYIALGNVNGTLAVYRVREVNGEPILKGLRRWPKVIDEAFS